MKIYIAASWKHQHAVEMLTEKLEENGHEILSWLREGRPEEAFLSKLDLDIFIKRVYNNKKALSRNREFGKFQKFVVLIFIG